MSGKKQRFRHAPIKLPGVTSIEELLTLLGDDWREHYKAKSYFFSRQGQAARIAIRDGDAYVFLLIGCKAGHGYRAISYPIGGGRYGRLYIHRAVCELFNGLQPGPEMCVRHLDTNMHNNSACNLAWGTAIDNAEDGRRAGKTASGEKNANAKLTTELVQRMRAMRAEQKVPFAELARTFGVSTMTAHRATVGKSWK